MPNIIRIISTPDFLIQNKINLLTSTICQSFIPFAFYLNSSQPPKYQIPSFAKSHISHILAPTLPHTLGYPLTLLHKPNN